LDPCSICLSNLVKRSRHLKYLVASQCPDFRISEPSDNSDLCRR
jgi:hypothetical protein